MKQNNETGQNTRIELTEEQRRSIRELTGKDVKVLELDQEALTQKIRASAFIRC